MTSQQGLWEIAWKKYRDLCRRYVGEKYPNIEPYQEPKRSFGCITMPSNEAESDKVCIKSNIKKVSQISCH